MRPNSLWEVEFLVTTPLPSLPTPWELVEEVQTSRSYRWNGNSRRRKRGAQFQLTLAGRGVFKDQNGTHSLTPGTGFLAKHYEPGTAYYYPQDGQDDWRFLWLSFYGPAADLITEDMIRRYGHLYTVPITHNVVQQLLTHREGSAKIQHLAPMAGCRLVMDLLTLLGDSAEQLLFECPRYKLAHKVQEFILCNIHQDLPVADIAQAMDVSREYLSRSFKKETGSTLQDYIRERRIEAAIRLLKHSSLDVESIAAKVGFSYLSGFTRSFKAYTNLSPTQYRNLGTLRTDGLD